MPKGIELNQLIEQLVAATDKDDILIAYKAWASQYDEDLKRKGYIAPIISVDLLKVHIQSAGTTVYDAGCGTGKVGALLRELGYTNITGADFSEDMLKLAKLSGHYSELLNADFTTPIKQADNSFSAAISVGVYSSLLDGIFIQELVRIVKPGGVVVLSCRPVHYEEHAKKDIDRLVDAGLIHVSSRSLDTYMSDGNVKAWYLALTVLPNKV
ncbi:class I SAM-dependent methyltransferase [Granulosicoccus sp.]|nr:class I SAM-dependent methyltransferase [Granulosicoccus sp.]MDB4223245.1 class I SAM-dependent methyltransferase [Granulosicoccus sp.]